MSDRRGVRVRLLAALIGVVVGTGGMGPVQGLELQGHRGARGLLPENTLAGFLGALEVGIDVLELDVALTADAVVVVSHDPRLNPDLTRDADGAWIEAPGPIIRALTAAELGVYDVGRLRPATPYANRYRDQVPVDGARIPHLGEVFAAVREAGAEHARFNIEIKLAPHESHRFAPPAEFARAVVDAIRAADMSRRVVVQSFDWRALVEVRAIAPELRLSCLTAETGGMDTIERGRAGASAWTAGLDVDEHGGSVPALVAAFGAAIWSPHWRNATPEAIAEAHARGLRVVVWTVNSPAVARRLIDLGVDGIITDYPDRLRAVMAEGGLVLPPAIEGVN